MTSAASIATTIIESPERAAYRAAGGRDGLDTIARYIRDGVAIDGATLREAMRPVAEEAFGNGSRAYPTRREAARELIDLPDLRVWNRDVGAARPCGVAEWCDAPR